MTAPAVGQHVGHAGRYPQIVLQEQESVVGSYDVGTANRDIGAVRHLHPAHFLTKLGAIVDKAGRYDAIAQNPSRSVDVGEEQIQRFDALPESAFDQVPIVGVKDSRQEIDRNDPLVRPLFSVDRKRDSFMQKRSLGTFLHDRKFARRDAVERLPKPAAMRARRAGGIEHLVVECRLDFVTREKTFSVHRILAVVIRHRPARVCLP